MRFGIFCHIVTNIIVQLSQLATAFADVHRLQTRELSKYLYLHVNNAILLFSGYSKYCHFFQSHRLPKIHKRCPLTSVSGWLRRYWITRENKLFELMIKSMICEGMFVECTSGWLTGALLLPQFSQIWFWKKKQQKTVMRGNSCSGWSSPCVRLSVVSLKGFFGSF